MINKTELIYIKKWINLTRWINETRFIKKNSLSNLKIPDIKDSPSTSSTNNTFSIDFNNIYVLGGFSIGGLLIFCFSFYIAWKCWLRDKLEEMLLNYCFGEWGEKIMNFLELFGFYENWKEKRDKKNDEYEYYGLTQEQIDICKQAKAINKIKYEEAL